MATITLDYDVHSQQARKALDFILSLGIFRTSERATLKEELRSKKREQLDKELNSHLINLSSYKFDRDEANNYE